MIEHIIKPFWKKPYRFLAYPFLSIQPVLLMIILALFSTLFSRPGVITSMLSLIPWAVMLKYSYEALRLTLEGRLTAPPLSSIAHVNTIIMVSRQIILILALLLINGLIISRLGPFARLLYGLCVPACLPAVIITLIVHDHLGRALNPVHFTGTARRIGREYLYVIFFLAILFIAPGASGYVIMRFFPDPIQVFVRMAAINYYTLVAYHFIGCVMVQYHNRLNDDGNEESIMAPAHPAESLSHSGHAPSSPSTYDTNLLREIRGLIQKRQLDQAITIIQNITRLDINDLPLSECYIDLLKIRHREKELMAYRPKHLELLVASQETTKAMTLCRQCIQEKVPLKASPTALFTIGGWFNEKNEAELAICMLNTLVKAYPDDPLAPEAYFLTAKIQHEKLGKTEMAKKVLNFLASRFPDHDITSAACNYMKNI
jgi:hypothetical protein